LSAILHILPEEIVISKIYVCRGVKVMLDHDLAEMYEVETKVLKQAVRRNLERFPEDFMFELTKKEYNSLVTSQRSHFVTLGWKSDTYTIYAFTETGVAMLSSVLKSKSAIAVNIQIMRVFTKMRSLLETHKEILYTLDSLEKKDIEHDEKVLLILEYIKHLEQSKQQDINLNNRKKIGSKSN
jgi:hypothetical protein